MEEFNPNPYRGDAHIAHASENFFTVYFLGFNFAVFASGWQGRLLGSEIRPRRWNRDYLLAVADEHRQKRQVLQKKMPTTWFRRPTPTTHSWERMWWDHLAWRRWTLERTGPAHQH